MSLSASLRKVSLWLVILKLRLHQQNCAAPMGMSGWLTWAMFSRQKVQVALIVQELPN